MEEIVIISGKNSDLANGIAQELRATARWPVRYIPDAVTRFSDGETAARLRETIRGRKTYVVQDYDLSAEMLVQAGQMLEVVYKCDGKEPTLIEPYLAYSRQDKPVGREMGFVVKHLEFLEICHAERVMTLDLHAPQIRSMFKKKFEDFSARRIFQTFLQSHKLIDDMTIIVSPDEGATKTCKIFAENLRVDRYYLPKDRMKEKTDALSRKVLADLDVTDCTVIVPDDVLSTGGTLVSAIEYLRGHGAKKVIVMISHCILAKGAIENLRRSPPDLLVTTNSVGRASLLNGVCPYEELSVAPLFAEGIRLLENHESLSPLLAEYN